MINHPILKLNIKSHHSVLIDIREMFRKNEINDHLIEALLGYFRLI